MQDQFIAEPDLLAEYDHAVERLLASISDDNNHHGGLLSRDTIRRADELRMARSRLLNRGVRSV
jgi:hypothetical protein